MTGAAVDLGERSVEIILANQTASGAFIASPTFSQYGYCWLRDGAFIAWSLDLVGERAAAARFHDWVSEVVLSRSEALGRAASAARRGVSPAADDCLHCRYRADGSVAGVEWPAFQLDGPGIWLWSLAQHLTRGGASTVRLAAAAQLVAEYLAAMWRLPSYDAWEEHPDFVHTSTLGAIATGLRDAQRAGLAPPQDGSRNVPAEIVCQLHDQFAGQGFLGKWPGSQTVDASLLWLAYPYRLFEPEDPFHGATLARIERELVTLAGGVYRYLGDTYYGGGEWILLAASLGLAYAARDRPGDRERALRAMAWIERQADAHGMLPEQVAENAQRPEWIEHWEGLWGPSARPLLWSHAMYLALRHHLGQLL